MELRSICRRCTYLVNHAVSCSSLALLDQGRRECIGSIDVRPSVDHLVQPLSSFGVILQPEIGHSKQRRCGSVFGVGLQLLFECGNSLFVQLRFIVSETQIVINSILLGIPIRSLRKVLRCRNKILSLSAQQSDVVMGRSNDFPVIRFTSLQFPFGCFIQVITSRPVVVFNTSVQQIFIRCPSHSYGARLPLLFELKSLGFQFGSDLQLFFTSMGLASLEQRLGQTMMRRSYLALVVSQVRIKGDCFPEYLNSPVVMAQFLICLAELKIRIRVVRLYRRGLLQEGYGKVPLPLEVVDYPQIVVGKELVRVCCQLELEFFQGFPRFALTLIEEIGDPEIVVGPRKLRIKRNRLLKFLNRFRQQTTLPICPSNDHMELRLFSESFNQRIVELPCGIGLTVSQVGNAQCVNNVDVIRR